MSGLLAALWLLGLFAAAPALRTSSSYEISDRLRDALILGIAIPLALGIVHLLYPIACWCALALCLFIAYARRSARQRTHAADSHAPPPYVMIAALVAIAWPQLERPLLDGDSLSYHLPNAASWVQAHSLWTTATRYWWYPPASELFTSGLYAVGTPFALPWCGFAALMLLGSRVVTWAREAYGAPPLFADLLGAATITVFPLAIQGGTLQNDVWLAAFWLETLWLLRAAPLGAATMASAAVTALIKPQGWLLTAIALSTFKAPARLWLATAAAIGIWLAHCAILSRSAIVAPSSADFAGLWGSTILAHGAPALALLVQVALAVSPFFVVALGAALLGPAVARDDRALGWTALAAALLFFVLPFGYDTAVAQLATGASLRFAAPAIAAGAVIFALPARRLFAVASALLLASTIFGTWLVLSTFWNDGSTHAALAIAALAAAIVATAHYRRVAWPNVVAFGLAVVVASHLAARHPLDYYSDALRVESTSPGIYRWIAENRPAAIGGWGLRIGVVNVLSPQTRTIDLPEVDACASARRLGLILIAVAESDRSAAFNEERLRAARACGAALYHDAIAVVVQPEQLR